MNPSGVDEKSLGLRLQEARKHAGLTQQELCEKANLAYSTLAKIERGAIKSPSIFTIQTIASVLGMGLDQLVGGSSNPGETPKKVSKSGVRFVYFDINGCLVRFFHRAFTRLSEESGAPSDLIESTFWHYNDAVCRGDMSLDEFNSILADRLGMPSLDWESYYLSAVDPIKEMHELAAWAVQHYHVGLLSNIMPGFVHDMTDKGILPSLPFDAVVDSSEVGAIKPEPRMYQIAQDFAHVEPHEILLVDDSRTNLMAAEHMGWHVLWFDDFRPADSAAHVREALAFE
jgi:putative hydrolase of the HAD superfamily